MKDKWSFLLVLSIGAWVVFLPAFLVINYINHKPPVLVVEGEVENMDLYSEWNGYHYTIRVENKTYVVTENVYYNISVGSCGLFYSQKYSNNIIDQYIKQNCN